ncbi:MAG TPA: TIM44-like domain-containing protein [Pseudolabrys sp.]|nr:TIM44-like domain-containing protein [Pseudolabrys sp.]
MGRFRVFTIVLAAVAALALATQADARVGGGGSFGSRGGMTFSAPPTTRTAPSTASPINRSMTQPSRPTFGQPGTGFFGRGLFGGLLGGFLGAGLLGMLFGYGFFGGMAGFASVLGLILQVVLVVVVARLVFAWFARRNAPAFAGETPNARPSSFFGGSGFGMGAAAPSVEPIAIGKEDYDAFERLLGEIQGAYSAEDLNALRSRVTPEMLSYFSEDLAKNSSRGVVNHVSDVKLLQGDLAEAWREGSSEYATVAMRFSLVDRMLDRAGRLVGGSDQPEEVTELWTFMRMHGGSWLLSAIQQA